MTCEEFQELVPAFALGALEPAERAACEAHLSETLAHRGCQEALSRALQAAQLLAEALPSAPAPAGGWEDLERRLGTTVRDVAPRKSLSLRRRLVPNLLAVAAAAAAVLVSLRLVRERSEREQLREAAVQLAKLNHRDQQLQGCLADLDQAKRQLAAQSEAMALLERPSTQVVSLAAQAKGSAYHGNVIFNSALHQAVLVAGDMTAQADRDYELWVIRGSRKLPAGLLRENPGGHNLTQVNEKLLADGVDAFAITLEPKGGSSSPRGPILLVGAVQKG